MRLLQISLAAFGLSLLAGAAAQAEEAASYVLTIKDHKFEPSVLEVPANKKITVVVKNLDSTPEEFESSDLKREKIVAGGKEINVVIGPLKPGTYEYFGEFHIETAKGQIIAK